MVGLELFLFISSFPVHPHHYRGFILNTLFLFCLCFSPKNLKPDFAVNYACCVFISISVIHIDVFTFVSLVELVIKTAWD